MGFPLKHILCGKLCFFFYFYFFIPPLLFGHLVPIEPSRPGVTALFWTSATLRLPDTTQFLCVCVCLFFVNAISVQSRLDAFVFGAGRSKAVRVVGLPHGQQAQLWAQGRAGPEVPASQTDSINKEFGESSIYACLCALNERQRLQRHAY